MDLAATILAQGYGHERARLLGFVEGALQQFQTEGWADDAVTAHRDTMSHWYRGASRLLEFSLDALGTVINVAAHLRHVAEQESALVSAPAAPASQDTWISFDNRGPGAWFYRNGSLDFQLPLINGYLSDYVAAPLSVGWLEQPVDSPMACGVPNLLYGKKRYIPLRRPESVHYEPGKLSWVNTCFTTYETKFDWWRPCEDIGGTRTVTIRVEDDTIVGEEHWTFEQIPDGLGIWFAESKTPLNVTWECDAPHHATTVAVSGMQEWRSFWNPLRMVHQLDIVPQQDVTVRYRLKPGPSS
jgi:hypothetical protein